MADHQVALKADEEQLRQELRQWYGEKGLSTPTIKETMERFAEYPARLLKDVIDLQLRDGTLLKISESLYYEKAIIEPLIPRSLSIWKKTVKSMLRPLKS